MISFFILLIGTLLAYPLLKKVIYEPMYGPWTNSNRAFCLGISILASWFVVLVACFWLLLRQVPGEFWTRKAKW